MAHSNSSLHARFFTRKGKVLALFAAALLFIVLMAAAAFADGSINSYADLKNACETGGSYILNTDITYTGSDYPEVQAGKAVTIDLHGYTINANGATWAFDVSDGDPSVATGLTIKGTAGGKITGASGAGINVIDALATFTLEGGDITGNKSGIHTNGGNVYISGGSITNNTEYGLIIHTNSTNAARLFLSGSPKITGNKDSDIILRSPNESPIEIKDITILHDFAKPDSPITVQITERSLIKEGPFTGGFKAYCTGEPSEYFKSYNENYSVVWKGNEAALIRNYEVRFVDEDGMTVLLSGVRYPRGTKADEIVKPADPVKAADIKYTYTFAGWSPVVADVSGDATYKATYTKTINKYKVTFVDEDGTTVLKGAAEYEYGTKADEIVKPADPVKAADIKYTYTFAGWSPVVADVSGDATYKATYTAVPRKYTVTFETGGGSAVAAQTVESGMTAAKPADPARPGFIFDGWYQDASFTAAFDFSAPVTADTTIYARWIGIAYTVVSGGNSAWTKDSGDLLTITVKRSEADDTCFSHFAGIEIDGKTLSAADYEARPGSTVVTLTASALQKLPAGSHVIAVLFDDGKAETGLTVEAAPAPVPDSNVPRTGDNSHLGLWIGMTALPFIWLAGAAIRNRKRRSAPER